jgi:hypothetical protein
MVRLYYFFDFMWYISTHSKVYSYSLAHNRVFYVGLEVLTAVVMKSCVFWAV